MGVCPMMGRMWVMSSFCLLASGGIVFAFEQSTLAGKFIIFLLMLASIFSWTVMWFKFVQILAAQKQNRIFLERFRTARKPLLLFNSRRSYRPSPIAAVFRRGSAELCFHLIGSSEPDETFEAQVQRADAISGSAIASVRSALEQSVSEEALKIESQLILLATVVSGAPFLGLLGTVWGVMDAFSDVASAGSASLQVLAPGVSGALLTTVTGLLVAIPAMFGYNYLLNTVRKLTVEMENFAAECAANFEHQYANQRH
ncbi:MAG: MotA/TolQ/ExbB proton channel family protein [Verrucomicrobiota bacterium]